jgi:hypothetical protein
VVLAAAMLCLSIVALMPAVVLGGTQGANCTGDNERVRLWENAGGDSSDGNDSLWRCVSTPDLGDINHTLSGDCNRPWPPSSTWNDCVSSITMWVPAGRRLCVYEDADYSTLRQSYAGPLTAVPFDVGVGWNDRLTSFRFVNGGEVNC